MHDPYLLNKKLFKEKTKVLFSESLISPPSFCQDIGVNPPNLLLPSDFIRTNVFGLLSHFK